MTDATGRITNTASAAAALAFEGLARLRHRKPLHPRGLVVGAVVDRHGATPPAGAPWLDEPGRDEGVARLSRSAGFPAGLPDVWGLALRVPSPGAPSGVADLLLSTAFAGPVGRHALALTRGVRAPLSCLLPYRTSAGRRVLVGALAAPGRPRGDAWPGRLDELADRLADDPLRLTLAVGEPWAPWRPFGTLVLGGAVGGSGDGGTGPDAEGSPDDISFDPALNPLPGLALAGPVATIRARAYAGARAGRRADPASVRRAPAAR